MWSLLCMQTPAVWPRAGITCFLPTPPLVSDLPAARAPLCSTYYNENVSRSPSSPLGLATSPLSARFAHSSAAIADVDGDFADSALMRAQGARDTDDFTVTFGTADSAPTGAQAARGTDDFAVIFVPPAGRVGRRAPFAPAAPASVLCLFAASPRSFTCAASAPAAPLAPRLTELPSACAVCLDTATADVVAGIVDCAHERAHAARDTDDFAVILARCPL